MCIRDRYKAELPTPQRGKRWHEVVVRTISEMGVNHSNRVAGTNFSQDRTFYVADEPVFLTDPEGTLFPPPFGAGGSGVGPRGSNRFVTLSTVTDKIYFELRDENAPSRVNQVIDDW
jgi:hypothetical protein